MLPSLAYDNPAPTRADASPGRALLAALPFALLLVDPAIVAAALAHGGGRNVLLTFGLPVAAACAFDWPAALRARKAAARLAAFAVALVAALAILSGLADLAGARPTDDARLAGAILGLVALRLVLCAACRRAERRHGWASERVVLLGTGPACALLRRTLAQRRARGVILAGAFEPTPNGLAALLHLARAEPLDRVLLAVPAQTDPRRVEALLRQLRTVDVRVDRCAAELLAHATGTAGDPIDRVPTILLARRPIAPASLACKAAADKLLSFILLAAVAPVLLLVVAAIRFDSPGPVLFRQRREGRNGVDFEILKFRTMTWREPDRSGPVVQTVRGDGRITRVGRVLRATSLDELPQLLNVLRGDMSLVGPRPHPQAMTTADRLSVDIDADYPLRHRVKPGMTGWAQINGSRGGLRSPEDLCRRLRYDLHYIENWSPWLDLKIALLTPFKMIFHDGAAF